MLRIIIIIIIILIIIIIVQRNADIRLNYARDDNVSL